MHDKVYKAAILLKDMITMADILDSVNSVNRVVAKILM